jgi:hypothetical protein
LYVWARAGADAKTIVAAIEIAKAGMRIRASFRIGAAQHTAIVLQPGIGRSMAVSSLYPSGRQPGQLFGRYKCVSVNKYCGSRLRV